MKTSVSLNARLAVWTVLFALLFLCLAEGLCLFLVPDEPPLWLIGLTPAGMFTEILMIIVAVVIIFWGLLLWLALGRVCRNEQAKMAASVKHGKTGPEKAAPDEQEKRLHHDRKLFLHLLSVMQTEGRLLDFLNEDLAQYEDSQIGAAARGVHDQCRRALEKYVSLQPLSAQGEGEKITVPAGFDPGAYRLSGNVTGEPPFSGEMIHRGWRAGRLNIPGFAFSGDPEIIAPIEVNVE